MASARSMKRGQFPLSCQLCKSNIQIEFKCVDCNLLMCRLCKEKTHTKFKNAKDHKVISTKDIGTNEEKMDFSDLKCAKHLTSCCFYCTICDIVVCPTCDLKVHKKHKLVEISEGYKLRKNRYEIDKTDYETHIFDAALFTHNLRQLKKLQRQRVSAEISKLKSHGNDIKRSIDKFVKEMTIAIKNEGDKIIHAVEEDIKIITNYGKEAEKMVEHYKTLIGNIDVVTFFKDADDYKLPEKKLPTVLSIYQSIPKFIPAHISQSHVGKLESTTNLPVPHTKVFDETIQYSTNLRLVNAIFPSSDGTIWLSCSNDEVLQQVKLAEKRLEVLNSFKKKVHDIAFVPSDGILVACEGKTQLQWMNGASGKMSDSVYDVKPLQPMSFSMTDLNGVIVRALNDTKDKGTIILFDSKGRQKRVFDTDEEHEALFNYPLLVKVTRNGFIHVVDCPKTRKIGKITVLNGEGVLFNTYYGHPGVNINVLFRPQGLAISQEDNVLVSDMDTHYLHVLNNRGYLLSIINVGDIGILCPFTLEFSSDGSLYIECSARQGVEQPNAQLCIVKTPLI